MSEPGREARVARGRGSRVADFAWSRGARGAGRRPPATLPFLLAIAGAVRPAVPRSGQPGIWTDELISFHVVWVLGFRVRLRFLVSDFGFGAILGEPASVREMLKTFEVKGRWWSGRRAWA